MDPGACLWLTLTFEVKCFKAQTDKQPDGKPDWELERRALNIMQNQIANCRQPLCSVFPWREKEHPKAEMQ